MDAKDIGDYLYLFLNLFPDIYTSFMTIFLSGFFIYLFIINKSYSFLDLFINNIFSPFILYILLKGFYNVEHGDSGISFWNMIINHISNNIIFSTIVAIVYIIHIFIRIYPLYSSYSSISYDNGNDNSCDFSHDWHHFSNADKDYHRCNDCGKEEKCWAGSGYNNGNIKCGGCDSIIYYH